MVIGLLFLTAIPSVTGVALAVNEQNKANARIVDARRMAKFKIVVYAEAADGGAAVVHGWTVALRRGVAFLVPRGLSLQREEERKAFLRARDGGGGGEEDGDGVDEAREEDGQQTQEKEDLKREDGQETIDEQEQEVDGARSEDEETVDGDDARSTITSATTQTHTTQTSHTTQTTTTTDRTHETHTTNTTVPPPESETEIPETLPRSIFDFHGFYIEYPNEANPPILGLVTYIPHTPPMLGWIFADDEHGALRYGNKSASIDHFYGKWDWTPDESRVTFKGGERLFAVDMATVPPDMLERYGGDEAFGARMNVQEGEDWEEGWGENEQREMRWRIFWDCYRDGLVEIFGEESVTGVKRIPIKWFRSLSGEPAGA